MKDLTKGKISTLILGFAIPVFLGNLLQLTYSLADTRIVGSFLGERSLAAVGATTTISNLIVGFLLGLANGFAIITAQKFGAGDKKRVRRSFVIALVLGVIVSAILILIGTVFINPILGFLNVPGKLFIEAKQYILIIIIGLWVTMFYDILMAVMRAIVNTIIDSCDFCRIKYRTGSFICCRMENGNMGCGGSNCVGTVYRIGHLLFLYDS